MIPISFFRKPSLKGHILHDLSSMIIMGILFTGCRPQDTTPISGLEGHGISAQSGFQLFKPKKTTFLNSWHQTRPKIKIQAGPSTPVHISDLLRPIIESAAADQIPRGQLEDILVTVGEQSFGCYFGGRNYAKGILNSFLEEKMGQYEPNYNLLSSLTPEKQIVENVHTTGNLGSNPGGFFLGKDGIKRYVKKYVDSAQAYNEQLANIIYTELGIPVPKSQVYTDSEGQAVYVSDIIDGRSYTRNLGPEMARNFLRGYAADVLLDNYDILAIHSENVFFNPSGEAVRIDNGSALLFEAFGGKRKPGADLKSTLKIINEIRTTQQWQYNKMFTISKWNKLEFAAIFSVQLKGILDLVDKYGGWENLINEYPELKFTNQDKAKIVNMLNSRTNELQRLTRENLFPI